ncbi:hypothetical protein [Nocardioides sp. 1609]|uniref:hypothetical protein n=1 Tax=Nocardioides sp. 1609 TaxID=2508327 RepID=UPI00106FF6CC|nr:hypothetical protein [Nocardioides sp. 1609]
MTAPHGQEVDYAEPAAVPRERRRRTPRPAGPLWDGPARTALKVGCWVVAGLLALSLVVPLVSVDETGADSPEDAVAQLLQGIVDIDPAAVLAVVDPEETADPGRARSAYERLSSRLLRVGEEVPDEVTAVLLAAEAQLGDGVDRRSLATLAAVELTLADLELDADSIGSGPVRVVVVDGAIDVVLDPGRLPAGSGAGLEAATYSMPLAEGWRADGSPVVEPFLTTVRRDGRWYVSLESSGDDLLGTSP